MALPHLGVGNAARLFGTSSGSGSVTAKQIQPSGRLLTVVSAVRKEFKSTCAKRTAIAKRISILEQHVSDGTVPVTLQVKIPSVIGVDEDVATLDDSVLSSLRENVTAASQAALEVMLSAKKKTKAALDQRVSAVDISTLFQDVLSQTSAVYNQYNASFCWCMSAPCSMERCSVLSSVDGPAPRQCIRHLGKLRSQEVVAVHMSASAQEELLVPYQPLSQQAVCFGR